MVQPKEKTTISAKVSSELKQHVIKKAEEAGQTVSEYVAGVLTNVDTNEKQKKEEIDKLNQQIEEKNQLVTNLVDRLEESQRALNQQQQLQLMAQKQVEDLQRKQLLLEENTQKKRWWQAWKR